MCIARAQIPTPRVLESVISPSPYLEQRARGREPGARAVAGTVHETTVVDDDLMHTAAVMAPRHAALSGFLSLLPVRPSAADDGARVANGRSHGVCGAAAMRTAATDDSYALYEHMPQ